jgi:hypothetical protein
VAEQLFFSPSISDANASASCVVLCVGAAVGDCCEDTSANMPVEPRIKRTATASNALRMKPPSDPVEGR